MPHEMLAMAASVAGAGRYDWDPGLLQPPGAPNGVPYLIGTPRRSAMGSCRDGSQRAATEDARSWRAPTSRR